MRHRRVLALPDVLEAETTYYVNGEDGGCAIYVVGIDSSVVRFNASGSGDDPVEIADVTGLQAALDGKAASVHAHAIGDVTGLQTALDGKEASGTAASLIAAAIGVTVQAWHATLDALAAVTTTVFGRSLLGLADEAALTAEIDTFTATLKGLVPASGGGTINYLRADGDWASPPGGEGIGLPPILAVTGAYGGPTSIAVAPTASTSCQAGRLNLMRLRVAKGTTLTEIACRVVTGVAGGEIRLGLYSALANGLPDALIYGSGALATETNNALVSVTGLDIDLEPGVDYWLASLIKTGTNFAAIRINNVPTAPIAYAVTGSAAAPCGGVFVAQSYGAMPADVSAAGWALNIATDMPFLFWR